MGGSDQGERRAELITARKGTLMPRKRVPSTSWPGKAGHDELLAARNITRHLQTGALTCQN
jgi:hypothetical protein